MYIDLDIIAINGSTGLDCHWHFFCHMRKTLFLTSEKEDQVARIRGMGGDNLGNARMKTFIFLVRCSLKKEPSVEQIRMLSEIFQ